MIISVETLLTFIPIALALNLTPGADMLFCLAQGANAGPRASIAAALGIATGAFIHSLIAGLGLAVVIATYPIVFELLRWSGVAYLLYLAYTSFRNPITTSTVAVTVSGVDLLKIWRDGTLVCLFNPKVGLFILALVPQFVDPAGGSVFIQFLIFGAILNIGGTVINVFVGVFSGGVGRTLTRNQTFAKVSSMDHKRSFRRTRIAACVRQTINTCRCQVASTMSGLFKSPPFVTAHADTELRYCQTPPQHSPGWHHHLL